MKACLKFVPHVLRIFGFHWVLFNLIFFESCVTCSHQVPIGPNGEGKQGRSIHIPAMLLLSVTSAWMLPTIGWLTTTEVARVRLPGILIGFGLESKLLTLTMSAAGSLPADDTMCVTV